ncbi:MAG: hypothetical protein J5I93_01965, partial [Pirellulaceae bacterium]|nr:hypothetical protein [Pirellulaceae bacterium]
MSKSAARDAGKKQATAAPERSRGKRPHSHGTASRDSASRDAAPGPAWHALATLVQPKLTVGPANDVYEMEADRVADRVLRMSLPAGGAAGMLDDQLLAQPVSLVQRRCAACQAEQFAQPKLAGLAFAQRKCA